jgi:hypothetical protein
VKQRLIWNARRHCHRKIGILAFAVFDPVFHQPLWLVISRQSPGKKPWYLLTSEPVYTPEQAFKIILIYARRWQIEMSLRFDKTELGFESLRAFSWEVRQRLFLTLALVHASFSVSWPLISPPCAITCSIPGVIETVSGA